MHQMLYLVLAITGKNIIQATNTHWSDINDPNIDKNRFGQIPENIELGWKTEWTCKDVANFRFCDLHCRHNHRENYKKYQKDQNYRNFTNLMKYNFDIHKWQSDVIKLQEISCTEWFS